MGREKGFRQLWDIWNFERRFVWNEGPKVSERQNRDPLQFRLHRLGMRKRKTTDNGSTQKGEGVHQSPLQKRVRKAYLASHREETSSIHGDMCVAAALAVLSGSWRGNDGKKARELIPFHCSWCCHISSADASPGFRGPLTRFLSCSGEACCSLLLLPLLLGRTCDVFLWRRMPDDEEGFLRTNIRSGQRNSTRRTAKTTRSRAICRNRDEEAIPSTT